MMGTLDRGRQAATAPGGEASAYGVASANDTASPARHCLAPATTLHRVITLVALVVAVIFLPTPWNWILVVSAAVIDVAETGALVWWSRRRRRRTRPSVGIEDLLGRQAVAITMLDPDGQVRVHGEIWAARSRSRVGRGEAVVVRSVDGLVLVVEPEQR